MVDDLLEGALKRTTTSVHRIQEFASLAGVTVRALHHYDRLGLLKPTGRSDAGYRLYRDADLARLEQIVVLKFLGLPLKQIGRLMRRESSLRDALRRQQTVLAEKRRQLGWAIDTIKDAGENPVGARAQALAVRWRTLVEGFTGGDPEIQKGLNKMWSDQANWPEGPQQAFRVKPEIQSFIVKAMKATR